MIRTSYDVAVLGAGFAGSLLAAILAKRGLTVVVIDRGTHPRFAIGESSTPAADFLLQRIASEYQLDELLPLVHFGTWRRTYPQVGCGCKRGFSYLWHGSDRGFAATAEHECELLVAASESRELADTHWYRADVDSLFADIARRKGVDLLEACEVQAIEHPAANRWLIHAKQEQQSHDVGAEFVVDATGPNRLLLRTLAVQEIGEELLTHSSAVFSHWQNVPRVEDWLASRKAATTEYPYSIDDAAVHHVFRDGWLWQLRFENGCTSVGFVSNDPDKFNAKNTNSWKSVLQQHAVVSELMSGADLAQIPGRMIQTSRMQRLAATAAGGDWAALPFTVGFIDPLHSTGIAHSLSGVERLAEIILDGNRNQLDECLQRYSNDVINELRHIDRMVAGCYQGLCDFRLFTAWTMVYFAAATMYERLQASGSASPGGFLLAGDPNFSETVQAISSRMRAVVGVWGTNNDSAVSNFGDYVRDAIQSFNHVGLFRPQRPNMYQRTAAAKTSGVEL